MQTYGIIGWASLRRKAARQRAWRTANIVVALATILNVTAFGAFAPHPVSAADTDYHSPTANVQNGNGDSWTNPTNAYSDGSGAASNGSQKRHRFYNYGFTVPAGSTITGIDAKLDAWSTDPTGCQIGVDLSWNGGTSWSSEKTQDLTGAETTYTLGTPTDMWGSHVWTAADFSDANFRSRVRDIDPGSACSNGTTNLDWLRIRVSYTLPNGTIVIQKQFDTNGDGVADIDGTTPNDILSNWEFTVAGTGTSVAQTTTNTGNVSFSVLGDTYNVAETTFDTNTHVTAAKCMKGQTEVGTIDLNERSVSGISVNLGETVNCVFLNSIDTATITVHKHVVPVNGQPVDDPANWSWSYQQVGAQAPAQTGLKGGSTVILPTTKDFQAIEVLDNYPSTDWDASYSCTANGEAIPAELGGSGTGSAFYFNLFERDEDLVCTFTNTQKSANITVMKNVDDNGDGTADSIGATNWTWDINGANQNFATGSTQLIGAGMGSINEDQKPGYQFASVTCTVNGNPFAVTQAEAISFPVTAGSNYACTFTNKKLVTTNTLSVSGPASTNPGKQITYTINWSVGGNTTATNLVITNPLPANTTFVSATNEGAFNATSATGVSASAANTITWNLGTKAPGTSGSVSFTVTVNSALTKATKLTNTSTIDSDQADPVSASATTNVTIPQVLGATAEPKLTITKTVSHATTNPGKTLTYTVVVKNTGDAPASNVVVTDTLAKGLTFADTNRTSQTWNFKSIAAGKSETISYNVIVGATVVAGTYSNTATAMADGVKPVSAKASVKVAVPQVLGLADTGVGPRDYSLFGLGLALMGLGVAMILRNRREFGLGKK